MRKPYNTLGKDLIMVPKVPRSRIFRMAHNFPIAGHYTSGRTLSTIRTHMDWPGVAKDVKDLCASCLICQKAGLAIIVKAPLNPLPVIKEPFTRIAMDVFWPLNRTKAGNKYILVLMDYATKWPEAFALRNVTTETIVNCLIEVTARIGVPQELFFFFFRLLPLSLRHFRRMSPSVLIRTRAVSDVEVAGSRVKTSVSLRRATCRGGNVEAVFFSPTRIVNWQWI